MNTSIKRSVKVIPAVLGLTLAASLGLGMATAVAAPAGQDCTTVREAAYPTVGGKYTFVESQLRNGKPRPPASVKGRNLSVWHQSWGIAKSEYEQALNTCVSVPVAPTTPPVVPTTPTDPGTSTDEVTYPAAGGKYTFVESELRNGKPRVPANLKGREISQWHQAWGIAKSEYEQARNGR